MPYIFAFLTTCLISRVASAD